MSKIDDVIRECITQIRAMIFGKNHAGSHTYIHLRYQIRKLKVNLHLRIHKYEEHINDFQKYLPFCPWVSGEKLGKQKIMYDKQELQEILETAILKSKQVKMNHIIYIV